MKDDDDDNYNLPFDSEAFEDLDEETKQAILGPVTPEQVLAFTSKLTSVPQHVSDVLRAMQQEPWWKVLTKRDTQLRRLRILRDAAVKTGAPVCSTNAGYSLGTWDEVLKTARRARRLAAGCYERALELEQLAAKMAR